MNHAADLTGWLVDMSTGLRLLGHHYPENYNYEYSLKISNSNIIYQILKSVPSLAGGYSLLFYKARVIGNIDKFGDIKAKEIYVQHDRAKTELLQIDISSDVVDTLVKLHGDYIFDRPLNPFDDWLSSI